MMNTATRKRCEICGNTAAQVTTRMVCTKCAKSNSVHSDALLDLVRVSMGRGLSETYSPTIKNLVELPMTNDEYLRFKELTAQNKAATATHKEGDK